MANVDETEHRTRVEATDNMVGSRDVKCVLVDHEQSEDSGIDTVAFHARIPDSDAEVLQTWSAMNTMPRSTEVMKKVVDAYEQAVGAYQDL
jgi:hypothetical protein